MSVKILQLHKRASYEYKYIQDKYSVCEKSKCYAIADGTTQSFNSEKWAELITDKFVKNPIFEPKALIAELYSEATIFKNLKVEFSENPAKASLEREKLKKGGTATFVGVKIDNNQLSIISCGDSNIFVLRNNDFFPFPFATAAELDNNKHFLNTEKLLEGEVDESFFYTKKFEIQPSDIIILATDALSRLLLNNLESFSFLLQANDFDTFKNFCLKYWDNKQMEEDDISAIIIRNFNSNDEKPILPSQGFSFPREEQIDFIPSGLMSPSSNQINEKDMQQLLITVNRITDELKQFKKKAKFNEMLLMLAISLIAINIFLVFYLRSENPKLPTTETQKKFQEALIKKENTIQDLTEKIEELNKKLEPKKNTKEKEEDKIIVAKHQEQKKGKKEQSDSSKKKTEVNKDTSTNHVRKQIPELKKNN